MNIDPEALFARIKVLEDELYRAHARISSLTDELHELRRRIGNDHDVLWEHLMEERRKRRL